MLKLPSNVFPSKMALQRLLASLGELWVDATYDSLSVTSTSMERKRIAFTDYRSQGQTLPAMIVNIATPPTGETTRSV